MDKFTKHKDEIEMPDLNGDTLDKQDVFLSLGNKNELDTKLKKSRFGGYSKSSVQDYVEDMRTSLTQMKVNLEQQVYDLTAEKATVSEECKFLREELKKAEQNYEKVQSDIKSQEDEYVEYCNRYKQSEEDLENSNNVLKTENTELNEKIEKYISSINEYQQEIEEKQVEIERLNACLDECKRLKADECTELKKSIVLLQNKLALAEGDVNMDEVEELNDKISKLDNQNKKLMCMLAKTKEECEKVKKENAEKLQQSEEKMKEELSEKPKVNKNMENELMKLLEKISSLNNDAKKTANDNQRDNNYNKQKYVQQNIYSDKAYLQLEEKFNTLHTHFLSIQDREQKVENEKVALENMVKKYQQKERDFAFAIQQNLDYKNQITSLQEAIREILYQMEQQTSEMKLFAKAEEKKRIQMQDAVKERTNLQLKNVELMDKITELEKMIESYSNEKKELEAALTKEIQTPRIIQVDENSFKQNRKEKYADSCNNSCDTEYEVFKRADEFEQFINNKKKQLLV